MKLLSIELQNFKPFRDLKLPEQGGELPGGLILIRGRNSSGKSSLFEGILWGLWGSSAVDLTNEELISFTSSFCKVKLVFEVAGTEYKIDRSYDPAIGLDVALFARKGDTWRRLADKSRSVDRKLESILNLDLKQALNTLLVRQGEVSLIANATPTVLRDLLINIYNIGLLNEMSDHIDYLESDLEARFRSLEADYVKPSHIEEQIEATRNREKRLQESLEEKQGEISSTKQLLTRLPSSSELEKIRNTIKKLEEKKNDYERTVSERDKDLENAGLVSAEEEVVKARYESLKTESKRIRSRIEEIEDEISSIDREMGEILGTRKDVLEKINTLEGSAETDEEGESVCPTCSKPLSEGEKEGILRDYRDRIAKGKTKYEKLESARSKLKSESDELDSRLDQVTKAIDAVTGIKEKQKDVDDAADAVDEVSEKLEQAVAKIGVAKIDNLLEKHDAESIVELQRKIAVLNNTLSSLQKECGTIEENISQEHERISELENKKSEMKDIGGEIERLKNLNTHAKYVRRKLVKGFVADYVFQKRLIGIIRGATNQYVQAFTGGQYTSIDLEPTAARGRSGPGLALAIWDDRDNARKKTSQLSFGDRTAISLGLRLGISRTMSSIRPLKESPAVAPRVKSVLLDEPLGGLDEQRRTSVVRTLVNDESFEQILLITHTDVAEWEGVPTIDVTKSGRTSIATLHM
ncbi:MAG: AAA family ATPase [Promethearchaeia archaeon]